MSTAKVDSTHDRREREPALTLLEVLVVMVAVAAVGHLVTGGLYWHGFRRKGRTE